MKNNTSTTSSYHFIWATNIQACLKDRGESKGEKKEENIYAERKRSGEQFQGCMCECSCGSSINLK